MKKLPLIVLLASAASSNAFSQDTMDAYISVGGSALDYEETGFTDLDFTTGFAAIGAKANENLSAELRVGVGVGDDSLASQGVVIDFEVTRMYGGYVKFGADLNGLYPYALIGYTNTEVEVCATNGTASACAKDDESDLSLGLGVSIMASDTLSISAEYAQILDKDSFELSGFSLYASFKL